MQRLKIHLTRLQVRRKVDHTTRVLVLFFLAIIGVGTVLLWLPLSARNGTGYGWLTALFTATSACCVTGLALGDTWSMWSPFGQGVRAVGP